MSTKHTPGPWKLETVKTSIGICHKIGPFPPLHPGGEPSHACIYVDFRFDAKQAPEALANAQLIASAPDLLAQRDELVEALNRIISIVGDVERRNHALNEFADVRSIARAALAKVRPV